MIGNSALKVLFEVSDRDIAISQLLEMLKTNHEQLLRSLYEEAPNIDEFTSEELIFVIICSSIIDYSLQLNNKPIPSWIRDPRLAFIEPFYYNRRLSDFEKVKLIYSSPAPFRNRNVYLKLEGLIRV